MTNPISKREENRLSRQASIVATARVSFMEHGYAATSMSTIACALGGSKATLWAHFASKEALFAAVLDEMTANFKAALEDSLRPGRDQRTTLLSFCERFLGKVLNPDSLSLHRLIVAEAERFPEIGKMFFERGPRQILDHLEHYLAGEMAAGEMRTAPPPQVARHLLGLIQSVQQQRLWNVVRAYSAKELQDHATSAVDAFMRAYAPDASPPRLRAL